MLICNVGSKFLKSIPFYYRTIKKGVGFIGIEKISIAKSKSHSKFKLRQTCMYDMYVSSHIVEEIVFFQSLSRSFKKISN